MILRMLSEPSFEQIVVDYLQIVIAYWWVIVPSILMPLRDVTKIFKDWGKTPRWVELTVVLVCLSIAQFLAFRRARIDLSTVIEEKRQFSMTVNASDAELQERKGEIKSLQGELMQKERPIILLAPRDPELHKLLARQEGEIRALKTALPSPKKNALQLSNDMLRFIENSTRNQPTFPMFNPPGMTVEQYKANMEQFQKIYSQWGNMMAADYERQFSVRVLQLEDDLKKVGLSSEDVSMCEASNGNTWLMKHCAAEIGVVASKLPQ